MLAAAAAVLAAAVAGRVVQAGAGVLARLAAERVAEVGAEVLAGVLEGVGGRVGAGFEAAVDVEAVLGAERHVDALGDGVGDHRLQRVHGRLLDGVHDRLDQGVARFLEDAADDEAGGLGGAGGPHFGEPEGEGGGCLGRDDFCREDRQLGDHRHFHPDDHPRSGVHREGDQLGGLAGVVHVAVAAVGELVPGLAETVDAVAGVRRQDGAGRGDALGLELFHHVREFPPLTGGLVHLVLVARRPVVAEHLEDPLKPVRQHD
ncbi:hypothetical protein O1L55_43125 [Streptomyces albulus]|uniref:hypothetical protein n=1 Tax=Streptomyces noursei TaxID=1971 RepID=UPI00130EF984|nr:hypothetical protein [Streptomyces noursei]MCZ0976230.1 hypothetical protein [Streptomyces noursei]